MEKKAFSIRLFEEKDREAVRDICHKTATAPIFANNKELVCLRFADPYMDICPDTLLIAADENDNAIGYLMLCPDTKAFRAAYKKLGFVKKIRKQNFGFGLAMQFESVADGGVLKEYPAHLHIDIYDGWQRMGIGHKLMDEMFSLMKSRGIKGVHLGVSASNEKGVNFYEKYGFEKYKASLGTVVFAKKAD